MIAFPYAVSERSFSVKSRRRRDDEYETVGHAEFEEECCCVDAPYHSELDVLGDAMDLVGA